MSFFKRMMALAAVTAAVAACTPPPKAPMKPVAPVAAVAAAPAPAGQPVKLDPLAYVRPDTSIRFRPVPAQEGPVAAGGAGGEYITVNVNKEAWEDEQRRSRSLAEDEQGQLGFRVQLYTSTILDSALAMKDSVASRFNTDVYLEHDAPYYKVRIGDYVKYQEADEILQRVTGYGYKEAWIVRSDICHPCRERREGTDFVLPDSSAAVTE